MRACVCARVHACAHLKCMHIHIHKNAQTYLQIFSGNNHAFHKLSAHLALAPSQDISPKVCVKQISLIKSGTALQGPRCWPGLHPQLPLAGVNLPPGLWASRELLGPEAAQ